MISDIQSTLTKQSNCECPNINEYTMFYKVTYVRHNCIRNAVITEDWLHDFEYLIDGQNLARGFN